VAGSAETRSIYRLAGLQVSYGARLVLGPLDLAVPAGAFLGILGPNGSGKTTLLRVLTGGIKPNAGSVLLWDRPLSGYRATEVARLIGVVPQQFTLDFGFTVEEMVAMGRYAHPLGRRGAGGGTEAERTAVASALEATGMTGLSGRLVTQLSGGERQRALIAQTLAQETPVLLLDEPLNNLDLNHQLEVMQLLGGLHSAGKTIVVVLHDLNMAAQYCDELLLLDAGHIAARGTPEEVLDPRLILEVFRVRVAVHRQGRRPYLTPLWARASEAGAVTATGDAGEKRVHVIAGGGAASELIEELVLHGFSPTVGIVSVFDTDYATAQRYELEVVAAPPFQPFPDDAVEQLKAHLDAADVVFVSAIFFGPGNLEPLAVALAAAQAGKKVVVADSPPVEQRDLSGGRATKLVEQLFAAGADRVTDVRQAVESLAAPPDPR
jgi:cobalamin transport system ATP-binding protein